MPVSTPCPVLTGFRTICNEKSSFTATAVESGFLIAFLGRAGAEWNGLNVRGEHPSGLSSNTLPETIELELYAAIAAACWRQRV